MMVDSQHEIHQKANASGVCLDVEHVALLEQNTAKAREFRVRTHQGRSHSIGV
jgi:hypothetical protein